MEKPANTYFPVLDLIAKRWSPRAFADQLLDQQQIGSLFEAARWAPSCFNDQPWRFIYATRDDVEGFEKALGCLTEQNQLWAKNASILILAMARTTFNHNGKPNRWGPHDVGLASANLVFQAESMGLKAHFIGGIQPDVIAKAFGVPEGFQAMSAIAVGWPSEPDDLPEKLKEMEVKPRQRLPLKDVVFQGHWGDAASIAE